MFPTPQESAQRMLDRLPRPPHELPACDPMRAAADLLREQTSIDVLEDQVAELEGDVEDLGRVESNLADLKTLVAGWRSDLKSALRAADDETVSVDQRLRELDEACEEIEKQMGDTE